MKHLSLVKNFFHFLLYKLTNNSKYYQRSFSFLAHIYSDQRKLWDNASIAYDKFFDQTLPDSNFIKILISHTNKDQKILEFGCSTGMNLKFLSSKGYKFLYGIDISSRSIQIAKKNFGINFDVLDLSTQNLKSRFDVIFIRAVLQHINPTTLNVIINKLLKSLKRGGRIIFKEAYNVNLPFERIKGHRVYHTYNHNYFTFFEVKKLTYKDGIFIYNKTN